MQPFVSVPEDMGNMHKELGKDRMCGSGDILADRRTDIQTDTIITILRNCSHGRNKNI